MTKDEVNTKQRKEMVGGITGEEKKYARTKLKMGKGSIGFMGVEGDTEDGTYPFENN